LGAASSMVSSSPFASSSAPLLRSASTFANLGSDGIVSIAIGGFVAAGRCSRLETPGLPGGPHLPEAGAAASLGAGSNTWSGIFGMGFLRLSMAALFRTMLLSPVMAST